MSETPPDFRRHAPELGENNNYILTELLGYSQQESPIWSSSRSFFEVKIIHFLNAKL